MAVAALLFAVLRIVDGKWIALAATAAAERAAAVDFCPVLAMAAVAAAVSPRD